MGKSPADLSEDERDIHNLSFAAGASWAMRIALRAVHDKHSRVLEE
jgi:hypothetical protein